MSRSDDDMTDKIIEICIGLAVGGVMLAVVIAYVILPMFGINLGQ